MKYKFIAVIATSFAWLILSNSSAYAQTNPSKCVSKITERLEALGQTAEFDFLKAREIMKDFDFGKISEAVSDPAKAEAFKRVFTSLSELIDLAPALSGKGMKGYTKQSGLLIDSSSLTKTNANIEIFQNAFKLNGNVKGADLDAVLSNLDDTFDFNGATRTFTSKGAVKWKLAPHPQGSYFPSGSFGGEPDSLTHILNRHSPNDVTTGSDKSIFNDAKKVLDYLDQAMNAPVASRIPTGNGKFVVDLDPTIVGKTQPTLGPPLVPGVNTTKIEIIVRANDPNIIHTAYPK
jgi:hypothetical protein